MKHCANVVHEAGQHGRTVCWHVVKRLKGRQVRLQHENPFNYGGETTDTEERCKHFTPVIGMVNEISTDHNSKSSCAYSVILRSKHFFDFIDREIIPAGQRARTRIVQRTADLIDLVFIVIQGNKKRVPQADDRQKYRGFDQTPIQIHAEFNVWT